MATIYIPREMGDPYKTHLEISVNGRTIRIPEGQSVVVSEAIYSAVAGMMQKELPKPVPTLEERIAGMEGLLTPIDEQKSKYLALVAEEKKRAVLGDVSKIAEIVRGCKTLDQIKEYFDIGDQITVPWKDMDDAAHNTDETAYQVSFAVADYQMVTLEDGRSAPGLMLQMEQSAPYAVCFSNARAVYHCAETLAPGTYDITLNAKYGSIAAGTTLEFTISKSVPEGGVIFLGNNKGVETYAADRATRIESTTATATTTPTGVSLGTTGQGGLNTVARMTSGHYRWSTSALRQWLNGSGDNWWNAQTEFDMAPSQRTKKGFKAGFNADFLAAVRPVQVSTLTNVYDGAKEPPEKRVWDDGSGRAVAVGETFDTFFEPSLQQVCGDYYYDNEGPRLRYWVSKLNNIDHYAAWYSEVHEAYKIPCLKDGAPKVTGLRSGILGLEYTRLILDPRGFISDSPANGTIYSAPLCVIC